MANHNHPPHPSDDSDHDPLGIPETPADMFPDDFDPKSGHAKETIIPEMLQMGHLMEAGRLIVGKEFFDEPAEVVDLPRRERPSDTDDLK